MLFLPCQNKQSNWCLTCPIVIPLCAYSVPFCHGVISKNWHQDSTRLVRVKVELSKRIEVVWKAEVKDECSIATEDRLIINKMRLFRSTHFTFKLLRYKYGIWGLHFFWLEEKLLKLFICQFLKTCLPQISGSEQMD